MVSIGPGRASSVLHHVQRRDPGTSSAAADDHCLLHSAELTFLLLLLAVFLDSVDLSPGALVATAKQLAFVHLVALTEILLLLVKLPTASAPLAGAC